MYLPYLFSKGKDEAVLAHWLPNQKTFTERLFKHLKKKRKNCDILPITGNVKLRPRQERAEKRVGQVFLKIAKTSSNVPTRNLLPPNYNEAKLSARISSPPSGENYSSEPNKFRSSHKFQQRSQQSHFTRSLQRFQETFSHGFLDTFFRQYLQQLFFCNSWNQVKCTVRNTAVCSAVNDSPVQSTGIHTHYFNRSFARTLQTVVSPEKSDYTFEVSWLGTSTRHFASWINTRSAEVL